MFSALNLHQCRMLKRLTLETSAPLPAYGVNLTIINSFEIFIYSLNCERLIRNGAFAVAIMLGGCSKRTGAYYFSLHSDNMAAIFPEQVTLAKI